MQFRQLGPTDTRVSAMAVGCWVMGGHMWADPNDDESVAASENGE